MSNFLGKRIVLIDRNGTPHAFDVDVDFVKVAEELQHRAMRNRSRIAVVAHGAIKVEYIPS